MRSALAKGLGVEEDKIKVDFKSGSASVDMGDAAVDSTALASAMGATNKYSAIPTD